MYRGEQATNMERQGRCPTMTRVILNDDLIKRWKQEIAGQYAAASSSVRAAKLAERVHQTVMKELPAFDLAYKRKLLHEVLSRSLEAGVMNLDHVRILQVCLEKNSLDPLQTRRPLANWIQEHGAADQSVEEIERLLQTEDGVKELQEIIIQSREEWSELAVAEVAAAAFPAGTKSAVAATVKVAMSPDSAMEMSRPANHLSWRKPRKPFTTSSLGWSAVVVIFLGTAMLLALHPQTREGESEWEGLQSAWEAAPYRLDMLPYFQNLIDIHLDIPLSYRYRPVEKEKLQNWLKERQSILHQDVYYEAIVGAAQSANLHPALLFAITGQEQGFVPMNHPQASQIANNPFNVYHSWQDYNTTTEEAARIAAKTVVNLSRDRPPDVPFLKWVNRKYAEDPAWWLGVSQLYKQILEEAIQEELNEQ
ncbi:hypothetical protein [Marinicrinis sediminis]|uniref:Mannosyl-glycoprotein endo-beta-N-acetylglucosamidase-like domain-containing protein n=1 Tax=Marinicrinis sediminis TaxID=1652465 RepID=A0ABW5REC4_9BACL